MAQRHNFRNLKTWKLAMDLVDDVYEITSHLPKDERYGLRSQMTRCSVSIPSNIAEGSAKRSNKDFIRFLGISLGSAYELETQLTICQRRRMLPEEQLLRCLDLTQEIQRMLTGFQNYLAKPTTHSSTLHDDGGQFYQGFEF